MSPLDAARDGKCDVCGKSEGIAGGVCSALGAVSFAFCRECLLSGAEPYGMCVGLMMAYSDWSDDYRSILDASLIVAGKTTLEFDADVTAALAEYEAAL